MPGRTKVLTRAIGLAAAIFGAPALAQTQLFFDADQYGQPNKAFTESAANQEVLEVLMGKTDVFEEIDDLHASDPFRRAGRAVGLLDLLVEVPDGRRANTTCTATLIGEGLALTNHHCIPGKGFTTRAAELRLGFLDRAGAPGEAFTVDVRPVEANAALDYAIVRVSGVPADKYPAARVAPRAVEARESLYLLHHPAGYPQRLTRVRCQAGEPARDGRGRLIHHCDTLGGSSGALVFAAADGAAAGLHHAGVPDPIRPMNFAIAFDRLAAESETLKRLAALSSGQAASTTPSSPPPSATTSAPPPVVAAPLPSATASGRRAGEEFRDCSDCPVMVVVPAGSFTMGSPAGEKDRGSDEGPQRTVTIPRAFAVGKFEVTWAEWAACVAARACDQGPVDKAGGDNGWGKGARPVIEVSWNDAQAYARWLSSKTGERYRLLTEAEWEYAARAGTTTRFSFGDDEARLGDHAWYYVNAGGKTQAVGGKAANPFGLHDMHGNVWEWVEDCYEGSYAAGQPSDGSAYTTPDCSLRVFRGGSWNGNPQGLRSANRYGDVPANRVNGIGFRLARTVSPGG